MVIGFIMGSPSISLADKAIVPGSIKEKEFIHMMKVKGMNLDCQDYSHGCTNNKGTELEVISYQPFTPEQLDLIIEVAAHTRRS